MAQVRAQRAQADHALPALWLQQLTGHECKDGPDWLAEARQNALAEMTLTGRLPGRKDEHWKYFSLQALEDAQPELGFLQSPIPPTPAPFLLDLAGIALPVQIGTHPEWPGDLLRSLPEGLRLLNLQQALEDSQLAERMQQVVAKPELKGPGHLFEALNTACLFDALVIHVAAGMDAGRLHIEWLQGAANQFHNFRLLVSLEQGARLQLVETLPEQTDPAAQAGSVFNLLTQCELAEAARLDHLRVQAASAQQHLLQFVKVSQGSDSHYRYTGFELGGGLVRNDLLCQLNGTGAKADLAAAFIGKGESCIDHHILADHHAKNCRSEQNFRGVLGDRSRGVFNGKALIRPGADGSSVRQSNANLLLSDLAEMNTKPELEIYADEVEASHGATVGQLDEQALFYLQSRGLDEVAARRILTGAFCRAIGNRLSDRILLEQIEALLDAAMPGTAYFGEAES